VKLAAVLLLFAACDAVPAGDGPRRIVVREIGEEVIAPTYADFAVRAAAHRDAVTELASVPDAATLDAAQESWRAARAPWMESQAFRFGPVIDRVLDAAIDQTPIDPADVDALLVDTAPVDDAYVDALGANKKGFHALEYLLFDPTGGDAAVLDAMAAQPRRAQLARALAVDLAQRADELDVAWSPDGEDYVDHFADVGADGATFPTIKAAVDGLVNECVFLSERITDTKLGRPELEESRPSDNSLDDILSNLEGLRRIWEHLRPLIAERSPVIAAQIDGEFDAAVAAVIAVPRPFAQAAADGAPEVEAAWQAVRELRLSFATEVVALLGATLSFNDNDGD
jgi:predicted lipoprotein